MPETVHIARVRASFEFVGVLPIADYADAEKAVRERFRFYCPEINGFTEQSREFKINIEAVRAPELPQ